MKSGYAGVVTVGSGTVFGPHATAAASTAGAATADSESLTEIVVTGTSLRGVACTSRVT